MMKDDEKLKRLSLFPGDYRSFRDFRVLSLHFAGIEERSLFGENH